jgi:glycosyltransferase involved in cell wall biosynthesis
VNKNNTPELYSIKSLGIIIPAFNPNVNTLIELITRIFLVCSQYNIHILIVDDGSDNVNDFRKLKDLNVKVIRHKSNSGKGSALKTGFNYFLKDVPVQAIFSIDSDLQHLPELIPKFVDTYQNKKVDLVVGYRSRHLGIMPLHRILSNFLTSLILSLVTGQLIKDSQCGFRLINPNVLKKVMLKETGFHLESELILKAGVRGFQFDFVPIPTIYNKEKSSISNWGDTLNFVSLILRYFKEKVCN